MKKVSLASLLSFPLFLPPFPPLLFPFFSRLFEVENIGPIIPKNCHHIQPEYGDEQADAGRTAEPVSRDQILRRERGQRNIRFPCSADHDQDRQPYPVDSSLAICDEHAHPILKYVSNVLNNSSTLIPIYIQPQINVLIAFPVFLCSYEYICTYGITHSRV